MFNTKEEIYFAVILVSFFFIILVSIIIITAILYYNRKKAHQLEVTNFQNTLLQSQIEIQERTLQNISQEIHDNIGQTLSLVKLNLNTLDANRPNWTQKVAMSKELVSKVIQDLRCLSKTLHSDSILSAGLIKAIEYELSIIQVSGVLRTSLQINATPTPLDPQKELILFRMVQEALNNIIKHAKASLISVEVWEEAKTMHLRICDDGTGFDTTLQHKGIETGSGLHNMSNRARLIGGTCNIQSAPAQGTRIEINIPYKPAT
jgi:signal transduction histidine kinase